MKNFLLIILIIANIVLGLLNIRSWRLYTSCFYRQREQHASNVFVNSEITNSFIKTLRYYQTMFMMSDSARNALNNLFEGKLEYKLFYRIDFPYCDSCIYPTIEKLSNMSSKFDIENIIILTAFPSDDFLEVFSPAKDKNLKIFGDVDICESARPHN